jgi:hypothetical protein
MFDILLCEGITHIEDLPVDKFIEAVKDLKNKRITEKLDGANLWFGIDENGLYTSREGKRTGSRFYSASDYSANSNYNGFRAAHLALEKVEPIISKFFENGDSAEIEVLFGRQPNTVTYGNDGKNFIIVLRPVNGTDQKKVDKLTAALKGKEVKIKSMVISSNDGDSLTKKNVEQVWEFNNVVPMAAPKIDSKEIQSILNELQKYLKAKNPVLPELTNAEMLELKLNTVSKEQREEAKEERERIQQEVLDSFKTPIKELLLNKFVRRIKPFLQDKTVDKSEDIGVEGVVARDEKTGEQIKIVDKDVFTAINSFNGSARAKISGVVKTLNPSASIEMRGGIWGEAKIRIAALLGAPNLAQAASTKRIISKFEKSNSDSTAAELASSLNIEDFNGMKNKIVAVLKNAQSEIDEAISKFKEEANSFQLVLKTGKSIGLSPETIKKTITSFAETKAELKAQISNVASSKSPTELVLALYGRQIKSLHEGHAVNQKFSLLESLTETVTDGVVSTSDVAIPDKKLLDNKVIIKRKRTIEKRKKFQPHFGLRARQAKITEADELENASDVGDTAASDVDLGFKELRRSINSGTNNSAASISDYIDRAQKLNDEVDSVAFGLELDNGSIVKVYVAADEADEFEKVLSVMLGKTDDIEQVLDDAAEQFDIVDVEWPEDSEEEEEEEDSEEEQSDSDSDSDSDGEEKSEDDSDEGEEEEEEEGNTDFDETRPARPEPQVNSDEDEEEESEEESESEDEGEEEEEDEDSADDEEEDDSDSEKDEEEDEDEEEEEDDSDSDSEDEEDDSDSDSEDEEEEEEEEDKPVKKKKKKDELHDDVQYDVQPIHEEDEASLALQNKSINELGDFLTMLGFDINANRSFSFQAKRLQTKNPNGFQALKQPASKNLLSLLMKKTSDAISKMPEDRNIKFESVSEVQFDAFTVSDSKSFGIEFRAKGKAFKLKRSYVWLIQKAISSDTSAEVIDVNGASVAWIPKGEMISVVSPELGVNWLLNKEKLRDAIRSI